MKKQMKLSDVEVGFKYKNNCCYSADYSIVTITKKEVTKSGRIKLSYTAVFHGGSLDGQVQKELPWSNGALSPDGIHEFEVIQ